MRAWRLLGATVCVVLSAAGCSTFDASESTSSGPFVIVPTDTAAAGSDSFGVPAAPAPTEVPTLSCALPNPVIPQVQGLRLDYADAALRRNCVAQILAFDARPERRAVDYEDGWRVCFQDLPAAAAVTADTVVNLQVVMVNESCPALPGPFVP